MKYMILVTTIIFSLAALNFTFAHDRNARGCMGMMGHGMTGHGTTGYDMMMDDAFCPMMMNMGTTTDYLLASRDDINLSKTQISKLEKIRNNYQKDAMTLQANLDLAMLELHDLLNEDELNILKIKAASANIEKIESELRTKNIEIYMTTKSILTRKQIEKVQDMEIFDMYNIRGCHGMMMR